jgi:hypothetical protein
MRLSPAAEHAARQALGFSRNPSSKVNPVCIHQRRELKVNACNTASPMANSRKHSLLCRMLHFLDAISWHFCAQRRGVSEDDPNKATPAVLTVGQIQACTPKRHNQEVHMNGKQNPIKPRRHKVTEHNACKHQNV